MSIIKDTQSEIVIRKARMVFRVLAGLMALIGMMFFIAGLVHFIAGLVQSLTEVDSAYLIGAGIMAGIGLFVALLGNSLRTMSTKINFNIPPGYITVTLGYYPSFLPSLRTRVISREEAKSVFVYPVEHTVIPLFGNPYTHTSSYRINVVMLSGKEITLHTDARQHIANRLAERILDFVQVAELEFSPDAKFSIRVDEALGGIMAEYRKAKRTR